MPNGGEIIGRYEKLRTRASNFFRRVDIMAPHIAPSRYGVMTRVAAGQDIMADVFDSTSLSAAGWFAKYVMGISANPASKWFHLKEKRAEVDRLDQVREWTEECRDRMFHALSSAGFYSQAFQAVLDYGGFGTGSLLTEEARQPVNGAVYGFRGLKFRHDKAGQFVLCEDSSGKPDSHYTEYTMSARSAVAEWGNENVSEHVQRASLTDPDKDFWFVDAVYPRPNGDKGYGNKGFPWAYCVVEKDSKKIVHESGYRKFPFAIPRMQRISGEFYGRGLGEMALPDIRTLNSVKRMGLEDLAIKTKPPFLQAHDSVMGSIRLKPWGQTILKTHGRPLRDVFAPLETGSHPEISQIKEEELRKSINEIFFVEIIKGLMQVEKSEMTAYEFREKLTLLHRVMGSVGSDLQMELFSVVIDLAFDIMLEAGAFPPPPPALLEMGGDFDIEFESPLARAQRMEEIDAIRLAFGDAAGIADMEMKLEGGSNLFAVVDRDKVYRKILEVRGVSADLINSEEQTEKIKQAKIDAMNRQQQAEEAMMATEGMKNAAPMMKAMQGGKAA